MPDFEFKGVPALVRKLVGRRRPRRRQRLSELGPGHDPELGIDTIQVRTDRPVGQEQPVSDLPIRKAFRRQPGDL